MSQAFDFTLNTRDHDVLRTLKTLCKSEGRNTFSADDIFGGNQEMSGVVDKLLETLDGKAKTGCNMVSGSPESKMSRPTKRACWKCGTPLKRGSNPPSQSGLCFHCSYVVNGRKRLGCEKLERS